MEEKGLSQLLVSDPLSIRFLTGIMVNPGERLYALLLRTSGKHTFFFNYLYFVSNTGYEEVWFSVMEKVADFIKEGMTEKEVADFIDAEFFAAGATGLSFDTIVCFGPNAADQHHTPSETRTFYCKSVDDEQAAIHDLVRTAVEKAEAVIKPGARFCDIDAQARDLIDEAGYSEYWKIRLGHFIGQEDHEYGDVSPINKNVAEPGMIFSIEPGIYIEGKYGVRIEDLVLVTEDGYELLNVVDKKWRIVG